MAHLFSSSQWGMDMKFRILTATILAVSILALGGCIQMHSATVINKDGSGTASLKLSLTQSVADALKEMKDLDMDSGQEMPDFSDINQADLKKAGKKHGVKITKFSRTDTDGRQGIDIQMAFKDLEGLSFVLNKVMGDGDKNGGIGIFDAGDGNLVLRSTEYDFPAEEEDMAAADEADEDSGMDVSDMDPAKMQKSMALMGTLMGAISELDIRMEFTVPGDIVSSNAPTTEGRTAIWTINSDNMMSAGQDMEPEIVFSGKGLKIKPQTD